MSHSTCFSLLGSDINFVISEYITELDYRYLILTNKVIRNEFLKKKIWERYKKYIIPFMSHLSKFFEYESNVTMSLTHTYPIRTKFYKIINKTLYRLKHNGTKYDFCSQYWINSDSTKLHIKSMYGKITNYMNDITVLSLKECCDAELMLENEDIDINNNLIFIHKDFDIIVGDHLGLDSSYGIAVLSRLKYIHIFHGTSPLNLTKYMLIPVKLFDEFIDITSIMARQITFSYPFLVIHNNKQICVVNIMLCQIHNMVSTSETKINSPYLKSICPSAVRTYSIPTHIDCIDMNHTRGHILSWNSIDSARIMHIYSLDLTMGSKISPTGLFRQPTHVFISPPHNYITGSFIHSVVNNKFCCTMSKSNNIWLIGDYSESNVPLTIKDLVKIPEQKSGIFELSWIAQNNYSYPVFINITRANHVNLNNGFNLEFCSEF